jgi:HD-GYP domain-containing protein (c-di-GMP phosphodiesterase class II)
MKYHHEPFNDEGYPDKLSGEDIPICSRIISLADSYDAMLTTRPYHQARSHKKVMEIMESECGVKSDPYLFNQFKIIVNNDAYLK